MFAPYDETPTPVLELLSLLAAREAERLYRVSPSQSGWLQTQVSEMEVEIHYRRDRAQALDRAQVPLFDYGVALARAQAGG